MAFDATQVTAKTSDVEKKRMGFCSIYAEAKATTTRSTTIATATVTTPVP